MANLKVKRCVRVENVSGDLVSVLSAGQHIVYPAFAYESGGKLGFGGC